MPVEGRDLSSRQTQYVVKDLGDWASYKLRKAFRNCRWRCTRKQRREVYSHRTTSRLYHFSPSQRAAAGGRSAFDTGNPGRLGRVLRLTSRYLPCRPDAGDRRSGPSPDVATPKVTSLSKGIKIGIAFDVVRGHLMQLPRRTFLHLAMGAAALPVVSRGASAQTYPSRPVRFVVSFAAGGPNDVVARIVAQFLSGRTGQQIVLANRTAARGHNSNAARFRRPAHRFP